jgi:hypothetical protein
VFYSKRTHANAGSRVKSLAENNQKVPAQGFEPWTIGLKDRCSAKLSYAG